MFLFRRSSKKYLSIVAALLPAAPALAAGAPGANPLFNPLAILLISVMFILLIVIGILGNVLIGAADVSFLKWKKKKEAERKITTSKVVAVFIGLIISTAVSAQNGAGNVQAASTIGGLSPSIFYLMVGIVIVELFIILVLLINVRFLIQSQKEGTGVIEMKEAVIRRPKVSWWIRFNKFKPIEQESDIDLGHEYDGIRELNNRLPPWWIYGFYLTIIFAMVYLWRYHVSHTAPLSKEEYEIAVRSADERVKEYLKLKGEAVNENTVTMLGEADIAEGKKIFQVACIACHNQGGAGNVGPNLTDDYWLHGGDIRSIFKTIKYGANAMPTWQNSYSNKQIAQLTSYVKSLHGTNPSNAKAPQGEFYKEESASPKPKTDSSAVKKDNEVASKQNLHQNIF
jgi:cytochrome c oxidase cbb3-type subunit 3